MTCQLRFLREDDLERVMRWRMLPEITRYMYSDPVLDLKAQRAWFDRVSTSDRDLVWIVEWNSEPVGLLSLSQVDLTHRRCVWAYYLAEESVRGKGLAKTLELNVYSFVFDHLELNKLCCEVLAFNDRVVKLHEKFGSRVEGVLRQHIWKDGEAHDVVQMAILREDWDDIRARFPFEPIAIEHRPLSGAPVSARDAAA